MFCCACVSCLLHSVQLHHFNTISLALKWKFPFRFDFYFAVVVVAFVVVADS